MHGARCGGTAGAPSPAGDITCQWHPVSVIAIYDYQPANTAHTEQAEPDACCPRHPCASCPTMSVCRGLAVLTLLSLASGIDRAVLGSFLAGFRQPVRAAPPPPSVPQLRPPRQVAWACGRGAEAQTSTPPVPPWPAASLPGPPPSGCHHRPIDQPPTVPLCWLARACSAYAGGGPGAHL